ncbi:MAG: hypothetical protein IKT03_03795, partial [Muribaculaceae bacterium]|nr:hypothetical protein [Muribaculaceae bacterium]
MIVIKHLRYLIFNVILLVSCVSFDALADGEQYEGGGTRWVDPVVFFKLQDINSTDFKRDYDQGDIDINRVIREKGVKIYGMRLKPIAAAGVVPKYADVFAFTAN